MNSFLGKDFFEYLRRNQEFKNLQRFIPIMKFISLNLTKFRMKRFALPENMGNDGYFSFELGEPILRQSGYIFYRIMN